MLVNVVKPLDAISSFYLCCIDEKSWLLSCDVETIIGKKKSRATNNINSWMRVLRTPLNFMSDIIMSIDRKKRNSMRTRASLFFYSTSYCYKKYSTIVPKEKYEEKNKSTKLNTNQFMQ